MPEIRGITISIGYGPILDVTLARNMRHLPSNIVITSPEDEHSQAVARSVPGVELFVTDAATRHQAYFNKSLCFEEAWDHFGRDGWWLIHDADILFPDEVEWGPMLPDTLYGARRRMLANPADWTPGLDWRKCPVMVDGSAVGFFQLFNGDAPNLRGRRPWYDVSYPHAAGGDAAFLESFPKSRVKVLPITTLHLGERDTNWWGLDETGQDIMKGYAVYHEFERARKGKDIDPALAERHAEVIKKRIEVPGYPPSNHRMPHEKRAEVRRQMRAQARRQAGA